MRCMNRVFRNIKCLNVKDSKFLVGEWKGEVEMRVLLSCGKYQKSKLKKTKCIKIKVDVDCEM